MSAVVFAGPSLHGVAPEMSIGLTLLPPAACGDVARAVRDGASAVGLIDGFFESTPSVWHKEILWALSKGVPVLGSSSTGALRAAEMWPFGMQGVGLVYRLYRRSAIIDDDEVALLHGPAEAGFIPLTEAMVNIRATLRLARKMGLVDRGEEETILHSAKSLFYKDRTLDRILDLSRGRLKPETDIPRLQADLVRAYRDVKREDAISLLWKLRDAPPRSPPVEFNRTSFWQAFENEYLAV